MSDIRRDCWNRSSGIRAPRLRGTPRSQRRYEPASTSATPWQRPSDEIINDLVRQHFPRAPSSASLFADTCSLSRKNPTGDRGWSLRSARPSTSSPPVASAAGPAGVAMATGTRPLATDQDSGGVDTRASGTRRSSCACRTGLSSGFRGRVAAWRGVRRRHPDGVVHLGTLDRGESPQDPPTLVLRCESAVGVLTTHVMLLPRL
jgi:hypothetical protein